MNFLKRVDFILAIFHLVLYRTYCLLFLSKEGCSCEINKKFIMIITYILEKKPFLFLEASELSGFYSISYSSYANLTAHFSISWMIK